MAENRKLLRYVSIFIAVMASLVVLVVAVGFALPKAHTAAVRADYKAPPDRIYALIRDVERGPEWRSGLQKVEVLDTSAPFRWRETADWGTITFVREVDEAPRRLVTRIADEDQGFGGTWSYEIVPTSSGSTLTITENGVVDNPIFRFMSRFIFGHYKSLETYAYDIGNRLMETPSVRRVQE